jgi:hypothetical protein
MLIKTSVGASGLLHLDAYTYDAREFAALERTLVSAHIGTDYLTLEQDESGREGRRYTVASAQIPDLENVLRGGFDAHGQFVPRPEPGKIYACRQLVRSLTTPLIFRGPQKYR